MRFVLHILMVVPTKNILLIPLVNVGQSTPLKFQTCKCRCASAKYTIAIVITEYIGTQGVICAAWTVGICTCHVVC